MANRAARRAAAKKYGVWADMVAELQDARRYEPWKHVKPGDRVSLTTNWACGIKGSQAGIGIITRVTDSTIMLKGPYNDGLEELYAENSAILEIIG